MKRPIYDIETDGDENYLMQTTYITLPQGTIERLFSKLEEIEKLLSGKNESEEDLITRKEACELLNVTDVTIWTWSKQGKIPTYKVGAKIYLKRSEVMNLIDQNKTKK